MVLDIFTSTELVDMHMQTFEAGKGMFDASLKFTAAMGKLDPSTDEYASLRRVRDVALASGQELHELLVEIGAEIKRRAGQPVASGE